ncbi:MAG: 30S ribosomal protein S8 [Dokdonella sp.]
MSMTDPIADMFTRIRNAQASGKRSVSMPSSRVKVSLAELLKAEGYVSDFQVNAIENNKHVLQIALKYYDGKPVIERLQRISRSGLRVYRGKTELPKVLGGLGVSIVSTSAGIMTDVEARKQGVGGEVIGLVA